MRELREKIEETKKILSKLYHQGIRSGESGSYFGSGEAEESYLLSVANQIEGLISEHNRQRMAGRMKTLHKIQDWIDQNNVYQVIFGHYDDAPPHVYGQWIPLKTKRVNLIEVLGNETITAENQP